MKNKIAILMLALATVVAEFTDGWATGMAGNGIWLCFIMAILLILPTAYAYLFSFIAAVFGYALIYANRVKSDLTHMPITFDDIVIAIKNNKGLLEAIGAPGLLIDWYSPFLVITVLALTSFLLYRIRKYDFKKLDTRIIFVKVAILGVAYALFIVVSNRFYFIIDSNPVSRKLWDVEENVKFADKIGIASYLVYSYHKSNADITNTIFDRTLFASNVQSKKDELNGPVYDRSGEKSGLLPNVVFMLLESTSDISSIFDLEGYKREKIFIPTPQTKLLVPMRVNAIGGGTWITEFETITGVDSRVFGYNGFYTHSSISPFVKFDFPRYLEQLGYRAYAYYPVEGAFYNAQNAYRNYGFNTFYDSNTLNYKGHWDKFSDVDFIGNVIEHMKKSDHEPSFSYVLTLENHSPHLCKHFTTLSSLPVHLKTESNFDLNCRINEYLLRVSSTSTAVFSLLDYLRSEEVRTHRPFILAIFGDHLPNTFVNPEESNIDYDRVLNRALIHNTFLHIFSSLPGRFICCQESVPDYLLPTLISAMIPNPSSGLYLGGNLQFEHGCGLDSVGNAIRDNGNLDNSCRDDYSRALTTYRSEIFTLN
jgi:phosphoglycerol transferase MdoB-like AlkP superfamily enzyme